MSLALQALAEEIGQELTFHRITGMWCNGNVISERSPWTVILEGEKKDKAKRARRTKQEMARHRAELEAERARAAREQQLATERSQRTRKRAQRRKNGSQESKRQRWRQQKARQ
eukprot:4529518-Amphidinium_carterae.1